MAEIIIIGCVIFVLGFMLIGGRKFTPPETRSSTAQIQANYERVPSLFVNRSERALFQVLLRAVPKGFCVHAKVRLEDIVSVRRDIKDAKTRWGLRARVKSRHVDFLITDANGIPHIAIELDGDVHKRAATDNADAFKDGIFAATGLSLIRVDTGDDFDRRSEEIMALLTVK